MPLGHSCLNQSVVWLGRERHGLVLSHMNSVRLAALCWLALEVNVLALLLGSMLSSSVRLYTVDKVVTALGVTYVVNTDARFSILRLPTVLYTMTPTARVNTP